MKKLLVLSALLTSVHTQGVEILEIDQGPQDVSLSFLTYTGSINNKFDFENQFVTDQEDDYTSTAQKIEAEFRAEAFFIGLGAVLNQDGADDAEDYTETSITVGTLLKLEDDVALILMWTTR